MIGLGWMPEVKTRAAGTPVATHTARTAARPIRRRPAVRTGVDRGIDAAAGAAVQLGDVGRADRALILAAEGDVADRPPLGAAEIGPDPADAVEIVVRIAEGAVERQLLEEVHVGEERHADLAEHLLRRDAAAGRQAGVEADHVARRQEAVGRILALVLRHSAPNEKPAWPAGRSNSVPVSVAAATWSSASVMLVALMRIALGAVLGDVLAEDVADRCGAALAESWACLQPAARDRVEQLLGRLGLRVGIIDVVGEIGEEALGAVGEIAAKPAGGAEDVAVLVRLRGPTST